jgi:hypothetical protein
MGQMLSLNKRQPDTADYRLSEYLLNPEVNYPPFNIGKIHNIEIILDGKRSKYRNMDLITVINEYHSEVIGNPAYFPYLEENSDNLIKIKFVRI